MRIKKTALLTGASSGIGREIANLFAKSNYNVVINYNNSQNEAEELLSRNSARRELNRREQLMNSSIIDNERVLIPAWMSNN